VRNTKIHAEMVVITARTDAAQQQHRARAFLDAGARWVLVVGWNIRDQHRVRYLTNIYESMNQERTPVRALSEGRNRLINDGMSNIDMDDPAIWAGLTLFGKP
jgi:CHAT domain-containing protein